jgi:hypothetical protein
MAVASLVLGIIALVIGLFSGGSLGLVGSIIAVIGIVFGALGRNDPAKKGIATAGLICSIIALALGLILFIACAACIGAGAAALSEMSL